MKTLKSKIDYSKEFKQRLISDIMTWQISVANYKKEDSNEQE